GDDGHFLLVFDGGFGHLVFLDGRFWNLFVVHRGLGNLVGRRRGWLLGGNIGDGFVVNFHVGESAVAGFLGGRFRGRGFRRVEFHVGKRGAGRLRRRGWCGLLRRCRLGECGCLFFLFWRRGRLLRRWRCNRLLSDRLRRGGLL